jgi:hypothetical protein
MELTERLTNILTELETHFVFDDIILDHHEYHFSDDAFRAAYRIFISVVYDKINELCSEEKMKEEDILNMLKAFQLKIDEVVNIYTGNSWDILHESYPEKIRTNTMKKTSILDNYLSDNL